jgi:hypothetical protein
MKFIGAIVAFLIISLALGVGIYEAMMGRLWVLAVVAFLYIISFAKLGCLPPKSHH